MAEKAQGRGAESGGAMDIDVSALVPKSVGVEDTMSRKEVEKTWQRMMDKAGLKRPSETVQQAFRMAVYLYGLFNGTSREGNYTAEIVMNDGTVFSSAVIPQATGTMRIRRFYRGNMDESYRFLKAVDLAAVNERFTAKLASLGVPAEAAFATADWMTGCPFFTPSEGRIHDVVFNYSVKRAAGARGGKSLEALESSRVDEGLEAQHAQHEAPVPGRVIF